MDLLSYHSIKQEQISLVCRPTEPYSSPTGILVASGQYSPWHYTIVYPIAKSSGEPVHTAIALYGTQGLSIIYNHYSHYSNNNKELPEGASVPLTFEYNGPDTRYDYLKVRPAPGSVSRPAKLPLDYVAELNINQAGTDFALDRWGDIQDDGGTFSFQEATEKFSTPITIAGHKYSLPTRNELASIFPTWDGLDNPHYYNVNGNSIRSAPHESIERNVQIGSTTGDYLSVYYTPVEGNPSVSIPYYIYAIRFQDQTDQYRSAFRYKFSREGVTVDCKWLGASTDQIEDVAQPYFWSPPYTTRKFPLYGLSFDPTANFALAGSYGGYWTSSTLGNTTSYAYFVGAGAAIAPVSNTMRNAVRLFLRD